MNETMKKRAPGLVQMLYMSADCYRPNPAGVDVIPDHGAVYEVSDERLLELVKTHHRMTEACLANGHPYSAREYVDAAAALLLELVKARRSLRDYREAAEAEASRLAMAERDALATLNGKKRQRLPPQARQ